MVPKINITSDVPVYVQIKNYVMFGISSGKIKPGDQLIPVKELGKILGVNFNTVSKAYRELEIIGLVYSRRGLGCFIKEHAESICREVCYRGIIERLFEITREASAAGMSKKDLKTVLNEAYSSEAEPYDEIPASLMSALKKALK